MKAFLETWCALAAALILAVAGVIGLIDQTTMITLVIVLTVCLPNGRGVCRTARRA